MSRRLIAILSLAAFLAFSGCEALKDAAEEAIEAEAGCTEEQLGDLDEPDLPYCSKAVACCKFIKGECGEITLFTAPPEAVAACNANEAVLTEFIQEYQGISETSCPKYLDESACKEGLDKTRENYQQTVDQGNMTMAGAQAPSCKMIVDETVNELNEELGASAKFLPAACEPVTIKQAEPTDKEIVETDVVTD